MHLGLNAGGRSTELTCHDVLGSMGGSMDSGGSAGPMCLLIRRGQLLERQQGGSAPQLFARIDRWCVAEEGGCGIPAAARPQGANGIVSARVARLQGQA